MILRNSCKNKLLQKFYQDSRLRGNDGELTISCFVLGFAKISGYLPLFLRLEHAKAQFFGGGLVVLRDDVHVDAACCAAAYGGERYAAQLVFAGGEYGDCAQFALHGFGADAAAMALGGVVAAIDFYALGGV